MRDICELTARFLAEQLDMPLGESVFYYTLPDEVDECLTVQRNKTGMHVPHQIDADVHSLRIAVRAPSSTAAYTLANRAYDALLTDDDDASAPGFVELPGEAQPVWAAVTLYDRPAWSSQDQQSRKVFDFTVMLITKR